MIILLNYEQNEYTSAFTTKTWNILRNKVKHFGTTDFYFDDHKTDLQNCRDLQSEKMFWK